MTVHARHRNPRADISRRCDLVAVRRRLARRCHDGFVDDNAFYATIAQVLPTLAIALSIENMILAEQRRKHVERLHARTIEFIFNTSGAPSSEISGEIVRDEACRSYNLQRAIYQERLGLAWMIGWVFFLAEAAALTTLKYGPNPSFWSHLGEFATFISYAAIAAMTIMIVVLPLRRIPAAPELPSPFNKILVTDAPVDSSTGC